MICKKCQSQMQISGQNFCCLSCNYIEVRKYFQIYDQNLDRFKSKMDKLARRAARIGLTPPGYIIGTFFDTHETTNSHPTGRVIRLWNCQVFGEAPKYAGWSFLATLQHMEEGNLVRKIPGSDIEIPEQYRNVGPDCNHCNQFRKRNDTYLLVHDDGTIKQVGSTCLRDFLGHNSPETLAAMAEYLLEATELGCEGESEGFGGGQNYSSAVFLGFVSAVIRECGWMSKAKARETDSTPTAAIAWTSMVNPKRDSIIPSEEDFVRAQTALEWAVNLGEDGKKLSDYENNVKVVARCVIVPPRGDGIIASILPAYDRAMAWEREAKLAAAVSNHVGVIGERKVLNLTILSCKDISSDFGVSTLYIMADEQGNRFKWFSSGAGIGEAGDTVCVKGTIKSHDEFNNVKQTGLSRCTKYVEKPKKRKPN